MSKKDKKQPKEKAEKKKEKGEAKVPFFLKAIAKAVEKEGQSLDMRAVTLSEGERIRWAVSTGSLAIDLICGGGYGVGRFMSPFGPEASGKTTGALEAVAEALLMGIPCIYYDAENALDVEYFDRIVYKKTGFHISHFMGVTDAEGNVIKPGLLYYVQPSSCENCFNHATRIADSIPDIVKNKKLGWCWLQKGEGNKKDTLEPREEEGNVSILYVIDSLKALVPQAKKENDEASPLAQQARALSDSFPNLVERMKRKRLCVIYTNQVRSKIGFTMGNPEFEPCGDAAKFYSSTRIRYASCATSTVDKDFFKTSGTDGEGKGQVDVELSWDGTGKDRYRYAKIKTIKNKQFSPYQETFIRFRYEKAGQQGDGIDPSFDVYAYLYQTGQCSKKSGKGLSISLFGYDKDEPFPRKIAAYLGDLKKLEKNLSKDKENKLKTFDAKLTWLEFKELVENPERKNAFHRLCKKQMETGFAWALYFANKNASKEKEDESEG